MTQPPLVIPSDVEVAQAGKSLLANGSALYTLASDDFEVLRVTFVFRAGSAMQRVPFSRRPPANMLAEGTTRHDGAPDRPNGSTITARTTTSTSTRLCLHQFLHALQILRRNARRSRTDTPAPVFPEEELRTYCAKRKQRLAVERTKVDTQAREAFARAFSGPRTLRISADEANTINSRAGM